MNSLEFINEEIKHLKFILEQDDVLQSFTDKDYKKLKDILQTLQQIKTELEAWKETKKYIILKEGRVALYDSIFEYIELENGCIDESNSEEEGISIMVIKKALEVNKNEKNE